MTYRYGPGPAAYMLPPVVGYNGHDSSRLRYPMYSFGTKSGSQLKTVGPGPIYELTKWNQHGRASPPAWSFGSRTLKQLQAVTPGPGDHAPEHCPPMKEQRPPMYSFGHKLARRYEAGAGPGPSAYGLDFKDRGPAYSFGSRHGKSLNSDTPGPAGYYQQNQDVYRRKYPMYSFGGRATVKGDFTGPGPANYYPQRAPKAGISFGIRHSEWTPPMIIKEDEVGCKEYCH